MKALLSVISLAALAHVMEAARVVKKRMGVAELKAEAQAEQEVEDTPGWTNNYGSTCATYEKRGLCKDGAFTPAGMNYGSAKYNSPAENCVACGKQERTKVAAEASDTMAERADAGEVEAQLDVAGESGNATWGCKRHARWCTHARSILRTGYDCDFDGIPDNWCSDAHGHSGFISSAKNCVDTWPHTKCAYGIHGLVSTDEVAIKASDTMADKADAGELEAQLDVAGESGNATWGCKRSVRWCTHANSILRTGYDCDFDGIPDNWCSDANGHSGFISSAKNCVDTWPHTKCAFGIHGLVSTTEVAVKASDTMAEKADAGEVEAQLDVAGESGNATWGCKRSVRWCRHGGAIYRGHHDCDFDGIPDPWCSDANGHSGFLSSAKNCVDTWPHTKCAFGIHGLASTDEVAVEASDEVTPQA